MPPRIVAGVALIAWGLAIGGSGGTVLVVVGVVPLLVGLLDICLITGPARWIVDRAQRRGLSIATMSRARRRSATSTHPNRRLRAQSISITLILASITAAGCGSSTPTDSARLRNSGDVDRRVAQIAEAVDSWENATTLDGAKLDAQHARNLIEGPTGPGFDANRLQNDSDLRDGLLPGDDDRHPGIASTLVGTCAETVILGDSDWHSPKQRWQQVARFADEWSETNNQFPQLPSHPQRIVGWATLTEKAQSLEEAQIFAGHAQLHVAASEHALQCGK